MKRRKILGYLWLRQTENNDNYLSINFKGENLIAFQNEDNSYLVKDFDENYSGHLNLSFTKNGNEYYFGFIDEINVMVFEISNGKFMILLGDGNGE
jgi:hypothetical protein